ncbi:acyl carrier protein [Rhodoligotrophos appendicifer]|uniref:acyl carrier protein n=1 Tax=Rhodoligotrophos appendicifer TaxID=987056 RepID=UPI00195F9FDB|nr:phosphopantetheine-binding protein [Rhodoligotrophos appendicifer]
MSETKEQIFAKLCQLIEPFNTKGLEIEPSTDIANDLAIDSVAVMDFVMEIEDEYDIDIPLNLLSETRTLDDLTMVVQQRLEEGA